MSVERIKNAIIGEAQEGARRIVSQAEEEKEKRLNKGRSDLEEQFQRRLDNLRKEAEEEAERKIMQKRSKHNLELLKERNKLLNSVFDKAAEQLQGSDDDAYRDMLKNWADQIPANASGELVCNKSDFERIKPLAKELDKKSEGEIVLTDDEDIESGMVFRAEDFEIDMTIRSKINDFREELTPEIARILFPENLKV